MIAERGALPGGDRTVVGHIADHVVGADVAGDLTVPDVRDLGGGVSNSTVQPLRAVLPAVTVMFAVCPEPPQSLTTP